MTRTEALATKRKARTARKKAVKPFKLYAAIQRDTGRVAWVYPYATKRNELHANNKFSIERFLVTPAQKGKP